MDFSGIRQPDDCNWAYAYRFYPGVWDVSVLEETCSPAARQQAFAKMLDDILASM